MMRYFNLINKRLPLVLFFLLVTKLPAIAQSNAKDQLIEAMRQQEICWNNADIPCFMEYYVKSDALLFMGKSGITYGWESTLKGYHKRYPNSEAMGELSFEIIDLNPLGSTHYFMTGKFFLKRSIGDLEGYFSLVWEKFDDRWLIISDHTSAAN